MSNIGNVQNATHVMNSSNKSPIDKERIIFSLGLMGIQKGDVIIVHSSLTSIGYV